MQPHGKPCHFCTLPDARVLLESARSLAFRDAYPVSPGHTLVIPRRHVGSLFDLTTEETSDLLALLTRARQEVQEALHPDGYNIGINDGVSATRTVVAQPVQYLQNVGGGTEEFLYRREPGRIVLLTGVAYCLRRFQPLIQHLCRTHWVDHVRRNRLNLTVLGEREDLEAFLFEPSREVLARIGADLRAIDGPQCHYCGGRIHDADVDHFVPFVLYPRHLVRNYVLAHPQCNRSKSDTLAARMHLERWLERLQRHGDDLAEVGRRAGQVADPSAIRSVAQWAYGNAARSSGHAWVRSRVYELIDEGYSRCFA